MDANSEKKVTAQGFTIIRKDDYPSPRIKFKDKFHTQWNTLETFPTKSERDRKFQKLMALSSYINN